jgi:transcription elongation GreA/GreB family factor
MDTFRMTEQGPIRTGESHHDRFRRLAEKRVIRTIKDIRLIGNLGNRNNYEYAADEVEKMFRTLEKELKLARAKFDSRRKADSDIDFSL